MLTETNVLLAMSEISIRCIVVTECTLNRLPDTIGAPEAVIGSETGIARLRLRRKAGNTLRRLPLLDRTHVVDIAFETPGGDDGAELTVGVVGVTFRISLRGFLSFGQAAM